MKSGLTIEEQVLGVVRILLSGVDVKLDTVVLNASAIDGDFQRDLVMTLEEELEVEIPDADVEKLTTVKDIVDYITKKKTPVEPKVVEPKKDGTEKPKKE